MPPPWRRHVEFERWVATSGTPWVDYDLAKQCAEIDKLYIAKPYERFFNALKHARQHCECLR
jgi:hypothetical protein